VISVQLRKWSWEVGEEAKPGAAPKLYKGKGVGSMQQYPGTVGLWSKYIDYVSGL